ncbi:MAG TPA: hypothetical protein VJ954_06900 [Ignavibacteriaceae bacterium]|nr:hypothetical protein [Ignavibacteriaceae bacterium]
MKMKLILITLTLTFSILFSCIVTSCSSNPTQPPDKFPPAEPDSTTQNFDFQTYEFGDGGESSWLNDVWIFNENNIWAVGYINVTSNTGRVNFIHWNGSQWLGVGQQFDSGGFDGIWAADSENIYFADGIVLKYDKFGFKYEDFSNITFTNGQGIHKLWGSSTNNIWGVGPWGTIVHYDGSQWTKIDFDRGWRFDAITGSEKTGIAYACATDQSFNTSIVELNDNSANIIYNSANTQEHLTSFSVKLLNEEQLLLGLNKVWKFNLSTKQTELQYILPSGYSVFVMALYNYKDVYYFVDPYGRGKELLHYNGKRFKEITYSKTILPLYEGAYAVKDLAVMVGESNNKAYLVEVKRR